MSKDADNSPELGHADTLWNSADALRGQVDAAEYKLAEHRDYLLPQLLSG